MKTPEERGPLGAWAYDSRDRLGLSPEQVVELLGKYDTSTIRKAEGNSAAMSRPLWRSLTGLYARLASERGVTLDAIPRFGDTEPPTGDQATLIAALTAQTEAINALVERMDLMLATQTTASTELMRAIASIASGRAPRGTRDASEREAPVGTGR